jgi:hypothetical protein
VVVTKNNAKRSGIPQKINIVPDGTSPYFNGFTLLFQPMAKFQEDP